VALAIVVGVPLSVPVELLKLIPGGVALITKLVMGPPVDWILKPVAEVLTVLVSAEDESAKAGAAGPAEPVAPAGPAGPVAPAGPIIDTPAGQPDVTFFGPNNVLVTELINISPGEPNVLVGSVMPVQRVFPDLLFVPATP
jgi:hypothetical protein